MKQNICIEITIMDTCGSIIGALKAMMKALVWADVNCLHPPYYLGRNKDCLTRFTNIRVLIFEDHYIDWQKFFHKLEYIAIENIISLQKFIFPRYLRNCLIYVSCIYIGIIGPDTMANIEAIYKVTSILKVPHIIKKPSISSYLHPLMEESNSYLVEVCY